MQRARDRRTHHDPQQCRSCRRTQTVAIAEGRADYNDVSLSPCQMRHRNGRHGTSCRHRKMVCPAFCIVQIAVSLFISLFVLGLPLGDPKVRCTERSSHACTGSEISKCFVCYIYNVLLSTSVEVIDLLDAFQKLLIRWLINLCTTIMGFLHKFKLEMYKILQHFDSKDFCETCNMSCVIKESKGDEKSQPSVSKG